MGGRISNTTTVQQAYRTLLESSGPHLSNKGWLDIRRQKLRAKPSVLAKHTVGFLHGTVFLTAERLAESSSTILELDLQPLWDTKMAVSYTHLTLPTN